jgi:hypothetical protein
LADVSRRHFRASVSGPRLPGPVQGAAFQGMTFQDISRGRRFQVQAFQGGLETFQDRNVSSCTSVFRALWRDFPKRRFKTRAGSQGPLKRFRARRRLSGRGVSRARAFHAWPFRGLARGVSGQRSGRDFRAGRFRALASGLAFSGP